MAHNTHLRLSYIKFALHPFPNSPSPFRSPGHKLGAHFGRTVLRVTQPRKASGSGTNRYPLAKKQNRKETSRWEKKEKKGRVVGPPTPRVQILLLEPNLLSRLLPSSLPTARPDKAPSLAPRSPKRNEGAHHGPTPRTGTPIWLR